MTSSDQERVWANRLSQARRTIARKRQVPLALERSVVLRDIRLARRALIAACKAKQEPEAIDWLNRLIKLRAEQTAILLEELTETYGGIEDETVVAYSRLYASDCARLAQTTRVILSRP